MLITDPSVRPSDTKSSDRVLWSHCHCDEANVASMLSPHWPHFIPVYTGSCVTSVLMLKENKKYRDTWEQVVTTRQHMVTIKVPEGKMDRGGWKYLMKKLSIQKMIWKLATEQRTGTEVKHLLSIWSGKDLMPGLWHQWISLEALCLVRARAKGRNTYPFWLVCSGLLLKRVFIRGAKM